MPTSSPARVVAVAVALTLLAAAPSPAAGQVRESRDWKRVRAGELLVVGNAGPEELRRAATNIQEFKRTIRGVYPDMKLTFAVPTVLVVFRNANDFARFRPRDERGRVRDVDGYFTASPDVAYMVLAAGGATRARSYSVLFHEYAHAILHLNLKNLPTWVDEGMAEFYSTFESDYRDGRSLVGRVVDHRLRTLRSRPLLPLSRMLTQTGAYELMRDSNKVSAFYAQSWALVHYLQLGGKGKRQGQLTAYLRALEQGRSIENAFKDAFATDFEGLQRELSDYVSGMSFPAGLVDPGSTPDTEPTAAEPMTEAEARYLQGDLLSKVGAADDADEELAKALAADPSHVEARIAKAEVRLQQGKADDAIALLEQVTAANPSNFRAQHVLAAALTRAERHEAAMAASRAALRQNAQSAPAWFALSLAALSLGQDAEAEAALRRAVELDSDLAWYRSRAYSAYALARHEVVVRDATTYMERKGAESDLASYVAFLAALSHRKLGKPDEAQTVLSRASGGMLTGSWTEQVLMFLQGKTTAADFLRKAKTQGEQTEAHTYVGILLSIAGDRAGAVEHLRWVKDRGSRNYVEYPMAVAELEQLERPRR